MKLDEILSAKTARIAAIQDHATLFLNGAVEPDTDNEHFRLYRDPNNRRAYLLIKKADVTTELHEWTADETARAGIVGTKMYRVSLKYGCEILTVSVTIEKLGETIAGDSATTHLKAAATGDCINTSGCATKPCCTYASDGNCYCDNCCIA